MDPIEVLQSLTTEGWVDPYPSYALLTEQAPVLVADGWAVVSSYTACTEALRDPRMRVNDAQTLDRRAPGWRDSPSMTLLNESMLSVNSPDHERMRRLVTREFTARRVADLAPAVERLVDGLCDRLAEVGAGGEPVDFMAEFAFALPVTVICELLGVPPADRPAFRALSADASLALEVVDSWEALAPADAAMITFRDYFTELTARYRRDGDEGSEGSEGLVAALVRVRDSGDDRLTEAELLANLTLLLIAGFETTTNLLGNGLAILLDRPELTAALRDDPTLAPAYVEEVLRFDSPVQLTSRTPSVDVVLDGVPVSAGTGLNLLLGAANRDPLRFTDPHRFDPGRPDNAPMSFGGGAHYCLGATLARLEARIALPALLRRFPGLELAGPPVRRRRLVLRGYENLPVRTGPSSSLRA